MGQQGWISIHRKLRECWLYNDKPFDRTHAWLDLLLSANHQDKKVSLGNELIEVKRGSFITSELKLMEKWGWGNTKTRSFLNLLETDGMIKKVSDKKKTVIEILNYEMYQNQSASNEVISTVSEDEQSTAKVQPKYKQSTAKVQPNTNNNDNNENNENKDIISSAEQTPYEAIKDLFNSVCTTLPNIKDIKGNRQKAIQKLWKDNKDLDYFKNLFDLVNSSDFLSGRDGKWNNCSFDWIIKPTNIQKILEGNYKNKKVTNLDDWRL